jgi:hypothetical protein
LAGGFAAGIFGIIALIEFVIAGGLLGGRMWGRKVVIALSIIDLILELALLAFGNPSAVFSIGLDAIVLYYMSRLHVSEYFKEAPYSQVRTHQTTKKAGNCPQCGGSVKVRSNFWAKCGSKLKICSECSSVNSNES